jgi:hypothetical protein
MLAKVPLFRRKFGFLVALMPLEAKNGTFRIQINARRMVFDAVCEDMKISD